MHNRKVILASTSLQRQNLLRQIGIEFEIHGTDWEDTLDEKLKPTKPADLVAFLSKGKVKDVAQFYPDAIIIGGDSVVAFEDKILGKPHTIENAKEMLMLLNGTNHQVYSSVSILDTATNTLLERTVRTDIFFKKLTQAEIEKYIEIEIPLINAGSYKIQALGAVLVDRIEGDFYNVVGLPISTLADLLKEMGLSIL